ncbi:hypothetical protein [Gordonia paraffinivorans]|uniref:hypothetical protein n=1 Tax=Gordonia paraffinivorans TaxID=175628 RepID=UPI003FCEA780
MAEKPPCTETGCDRTSYARGMCKKHYNAWLRRNPDKTEPKAASLEEMDLLVYDYEFLRSMGFTVVQACKRLHRRPVTVIGYYRKLGRPVPQSLWAANERLQRKVAVY